MKKRYIIGNWKSNKTNQEAAAWLETITGSGFQLTSEEKEVIVCPSFPCLPTMKWYIGQHAMPIQLGAQDISPFASGAYTGEVNGQQLKEFVSYVIVGHSERREKFGESGELINHKLEQCKAYGITPVLCISNLEQVNLARNTIGSDRTSFPLIIAYEPVFAIGTGTPDSPENANTMAQNIKDIIGNIPVIYGGSVTPDNVASFTAQSQIDGVLPGKASLDAQTFLSLIQHA